MNRWMEVLRAFVVRESRSVRRNRFGLVFGALGLLSAFGIWYVAPSEEAVPYMLLNVILYGVSLLGLLMGLQSAQFEEPEHPFLFGQSFPRSAMVLGKSVPQWGIALVVLSILCLPMFATEGAGTGYLRMVLMASAVAGVSISLGLGCGLWFYRSSFRAVVGGFVLWVVLILGMDLVVFLGMMLGITQWNPELWAGILLLNPLDVLRLDVLLHLGEVPVTLPDRMSWLRSLLHALGPVMVVVSLLWVGIITFLASYRLNHWRS